MKTNTENILTRPFHLHVEYFFRRQYCLLAVLMLMTLAVVKSDGRLMAMMREAYAQSYDNVSAYLREETTRAPITVAIARIPGIASK